MNTKTFKVELGNKMQKKTVTICACASRSFIDKDKVVEIAAGIENKGYDVRIEADLCRRVMDAFAGVPLSETSVKASESTSVLPDLSIPPIRETVSPATEMQQMADGIILACFPRAIQAHFDRLGLKTGQIVDIRNHDYSEIFAQLEEYQPDTFTAMEAGADATLLMETDTVSIAGKEKYQKMIAGFPVEEGIDAWYPVLDKTRCVECGKCHDFCLFGVYTIENKKVRVTKPQNCKNNCPACARMCPDKAIIFPKYGKSPINGGIAQEEIFDPEAMDQMYRERLRMRLQQRRNSVSLIKN